MPHAMLFTGLAGTGKAHFADCLVRAHLCLRDRQQAGLPESGGDSGCECHACRLVTSRTHPNLLWVEPEKAGGAIKVEQVRDVLEFVSQTSLQGEFRFVVINPADAMNVNAANALLKTLEEPSPGSLLILVSHQLSRLPATIVSRCQRIVFPRPDSETALTWLAPQLKGLDADAGLVLRLANGAPLAALRMAQSGMLSARCQLLQTMSELINPQADPLRAAFSLQEMESILFLDVILSWTMDLMKMRLDGDAGSVINQDYTASLSAALCMVDSGRVARFLDYLQQIRAQLDAGINFNKLLMMENVMIRWMECA